MNTQTLSLPLILPNEPDCGRCAARLQGDLAVLKGVAAVSVDSGRATVAISYDPDVVTLSRIESEAKRVGAELAERIDHQTIELRDLDCPDCAATIEKAVGALPGMIWASANFAAAQLHAEFERGRIGAKDISRIVESHGVRACPLFPDRANAKSACSPPALSFWVENRKLVTVAVAGLFMVAGLALHSAGLTGASATAYVAGILIGGWSTGRAAVMALRGRSVDMNVLMTLAVIGATGIGDWFEAATVVLLFGVGNLLQAYTVERTRRSIRDLMQMAPRTARVLRNDVESDLPVEQVRIDETVIVRPGERIPMDGTIIRGATSVNQAPITGESLPVEKSPGDRVFAGTLNGNGAIELRVSHLYRDTTLARIIHRVEEAQAQRAPVQQFVDRFAHAYTPAVVAVAVVVALAPPLALAGVHTAGAAIWAFWFRRALSLLIIACPCALVISTPVAIVTAIGSASRRGALIKGGVFLEEIGRLRAMLYDKTGTLTEGRFAVDEVVALDGATREQILAVAAAIERRSEHPLASAFIAAAGQAPLPQVKSFEAFPGRGVRATVGDENYLVGRLSLLDEQQIDPRAAQSHVERLEASGKTAVVIAGPHAAIGVVGLSDVARTTAAEAIRSLKDLGITRQAMLTGDNPFVARAVAASAGLNDFHAGLLPDEKLQLVRRYQAETGPVGMVGDGINDAPALATANVGIVMGAAGSDTAMETADVALMSDDLSRLPFLIRLSRRTYGIIRQNIGFSLATKGILLGSAVTMGLPLWVAVMGDVGVSLLVTLNALRLRANPED